MALLVPWRGLCNGIFTFTALSFLTLIYYKFGTVDLAGMKGYTHGGQWKTSSANSYVEAHLKKDANSATVTLDISKALKKSARMTTDDTTLKASSILGKCA